MQILRLIESLVERLPSAISARLSPIVRAQAHDRATSADQSAAERMAITAFVVRIISAGIAFLSHVLFARLIGQFDYGIYAFVWVLVVIFGNLSCLGFHTSLIRFLPLYDSQGNASSYRGLAFASKWIAIGAASGLTILGFAVLFLFGERIDDYYLVPTVLGLFALPLIALGDMLDGTARANGWALTAMKYTYLIRPLLVIVLMLLAIVCGLEPSATTAMLAALLASLITTGIQFFAIQKHLQRRIASTTRVYEYARWWRFAIPVFFIEGIGFLLTNADVIIVGFYLPPDQVAIYFAAAKTIVLMQFVFFAVKSAAGPRFSKLIASGDVAGLNGAAQQIARWSFWPSLAMGLALLLVSPWLLMLFGSGFSSGYSLVLILFFGFLTKSAIGPAETLLNMAGKQFICVWLYAITFLTNVTLNVILIPQYGLEGAAIATSLAMTLETILLFTATRMTLGIWLTPMPQRNLLPAEDGSANGQ